MSDAIRIITILYAILAALLALNIINKLAQRPYIVLHSDMSLCSLIYRAFIGKVENLSLLPQHSDFIIAQISIISQQMPDFLYLISG